MNILVCISNVPDTTSKINFTDDDSSFDKNGVQFVINPNDEFGLTKAVWMKDSNGANVTVLTVGDINAEATLRKCLAIGADKAIRIDCKALDANSVAKEIVEHCKETRYDLIICGRESIDYNGSIISPFKKKEGMEQPIKYWTPSIALSDMTFYYSDIFPEWYGNLFISALSPGDVRRLVIKDNMIVSEEIMFKEINSRIRSIKSSKNGNLIILTDGRGKKNSGKIIKVSPNN